MAFFTIHTAPGLDETGRRLAYRHGPRMVNSRGDYASLLERAGFREIRAADVTREYLRISLAWRRARDRHLSELRASLGEARVRELESDSRLNVEGIRMGLLRRSLFVVTR
jgi:hypothetical protein